ncbi:hypothetical protein MANES_04G127340v8 [Manihot esculenta]|uniref:Uncharacterized protein n=1 Tax=Manihot esculenta TaxID=3983 RepID=A0ACB7HWP9_MANES|nr:hypothetical protein MANES_04G127340v8 [Manihot esculenta]
MGKTAETLQLFLCCCQPSSEADRCQTDTDDRSTLAAAPLHQSITSENAQRHQMKKYTFDELRVATEGFNDNYLLGEGGFGLVYRAFLDGKDVAVKKLKRIYPEDKLNKLEESEFLTCVDHPNIVKMTGYCSEGLNRLLVLEFVPNKTLTHHLHHDHNTLDWRTRMKIALQTANGLLHLHESFPVAVVTESGLKWTRSWADL